MADAKIIEPQKLCGFFNAGGKLWYNFLPQIQTLYNKVISVNPCNS